MHMADALISPAVGGTLWAVTTGVTLYSARKIQKEHDEQKAPLMGALGAFVFAAQMINFAIPGTGSSGHLGGGLMLAILLGPYAGFLTIASILSIQALVFADGGLLALGCNLFNLGFIPCFIAYPLIYKLIVRNKISPARIFGGALVAAILGLQLGAFFVVLETIFSGITELPLRTFLLLMQSIHLAIGSVEGLITAVVVSFVWKARPEIVENRLGSKNGRNLSIKGILFGFLIITVITVGGLTWFASEAPDGLEWSLSKSAVQPQSESPQRAPQPMYRILGWIQEKTALLPDYDFKQTKSSERSDETTVDKDKKVSSQPGHSGGASFAGLIGAVLTLILVGFIGFGLHLSKRRNK